MAAIDDLTASVTALSASVDAAVAKIGSLPPDNTAQIEALKTQVDADKAKLDAAVAASS